MHRIIADAVISELQTNDACIYVKGVLFNLKVNANKVRVTEAFMDEIIAHKKKYIGDPLCADVNGLIKGKDIDHKYNKLLDVFTSQIIGSIVDFEKRETEDGAQCIITAKILKRYREVCSAISNLFASGGLKFSFELLVGEHSEDEDGNMIVDASEKNYLEGAAIVTHPACDEAVAMQLIAQCLNQGDETMNKDNIQIQAAEEAAEAKNESTEATTENAEQTEQTEQTGTPEAEPQVNETAAETTENPVTENANVEETPAPTEPAVQAAETNTASVEEEHTEEAAAQEDNGERNQAAIYVRQEDTTISATDVYDSDTGNSARAETIDRIVTENVYEKEAQETASAETAAETEVKTTASETEAETTASNEQSEVQALASAVQTLIAEIAELKTKIDAMSETEPTRTVASAAHVDTTQTNPFVSDLGSANRFSLLEKRDNNEPEPRTHFSLLDKA